MIEPNIKFAKLLFLFIIISIFTTPIAAYISYLNLSAKCSDGIQTVKPPPSKKSVYITIAIIAILSGLAAQMMNFSYTFMRLRPT